MPSTCPHCGIRVRPAAARCPQCDGSLGDIAGGETTWGDGPGGPPAEPAGSGDWADQPQTGEVPGWGGAATPGPRQVPPGPFGPVTAKERELALLAHLSAFVTFVGIPSFVGPLVVYLWKRDAHPYIVEHAREALNFNLSVAVYAVAGTILGVLIGILTLGLGIFLFVPIALAAAVLFLVVVIIAAQRANAGEAYRYPLCIRFLR